MTKRLLSISLLLLLSLPIVAEERVSYGVKFESYFDNREYSGIEGMNPLSGTDFAVRLQPTLDYSFWEGSSVCFGVDMIQPIGGENTSLFRDISTLLYYRYSSPRWSVVAGLFERENIMVESYSTAFFSDEYLFFDDIVGGVAGRYSVGGSFVEMICDWEGQPSETQREQFRLLSSGRREWDELYIGYALSLVHFAGQDGGEFTNVVDNALVNPHVGARFDVGGWSLDGRVGYLQSLQRDRSFGNEWLTPSMGEVGLKVEYCGFSIDERLYFGDDIMPLYGGHTLDDGRVMEYGSQLYSGDPLFCIDGGVYNRAAIKYEHKWAEGRVRLRVEFVTHATQGGFGTEQILGLTVDLGGDIYNKGNKR